MSPNKVVKAMFVINTSLTINQVWGHYTNIFLEKYRDILTGNFKENKTNTRQTVITVSHQYIWLMKV